MPTDPRVKVLPPVLDRHAPETEVLAHARRQADRLGLDEWFIADVDSHREPDMAWHEVLEYIENPVMRANSRHDLQAAGVKLYAPYPVPGGSGYSFQAMHGRIPHQELTFRSGTDTVAEDVASCRRVMQAMSIDVQVVFPTTLLALGMSPVAGDEAQIAYAYNRWMTERFCAADPRIKFLPYLPLSDPQMCLRIVRELAGRPEVVGFRVTSIRYSPVHDNAYMRLYAEIEETGLPLSFHAGPTWDDDWMRTMNRFISVHALSFVHCNMVHMTNWIINGLPERFPRLKVVWVESGLAWVPFLMQRLDHEYLKRTSEAPLLTRRPSEYMREMYYTSQPMEMDDPALLESTMRAINAETQLLYASDWPHWDFDLPGEILRFRFLSDQAKRNILGLNAARVFNLEVPPGKHTTAAGPAPTAT
jgi:predicted TIM-barrel fold metal-dependent hydrolase